ncbi:nuclear export mediator factor NEMF [Eurytemora carolleeae]|uniref:nuclear export mediator factor NEMF n=1 Tax=Eurytemora carolleeae TaxID=1294199 RepID=UPI000C7803F5|nr:nuclear export mediator factor NEMF [Eurytemora carolleeae]|eukprot:XP_023345305.1 nuclear export mediator factor NEMF-like [Eurytemora affinis]
MKTRFTTIDIISIVEELQQYVGYRVNQVYDIDNKTYLIKLQKPECKAVLLIESGTRIHTTEFEWPKNPAPSGFSMKLRKHINNKRLEKISQMGVDRVLDIQFGAGDASYHLILEMYDRGNLVLTDHEYLIMNILRPRVAGEEKFLVRESYPVELAKQEYSKLDEKNLLNLLKSGKPVDTVKKIVMPHFEYGPSLLEHICLENGVTINSKLKDFNLETDFPRLLAAFTSLDNFFKTAARNGVIVQKAETRPKADGSTEGFFTFQEFHPYLYKQHSNSSILEFPSFNSACDTFFSQVEAQKIEMKSIQQEKNALKKLENVKKDHETRIRSLQEIQAADRRRGELIEMNNGVVENAIKVVVSAVANQIPWDQIKEIIKEATDAGDPVASRIKQLKLEVNHIVLLLTDPYAHLDEDSDKSESESEARELLVEIDLDLSAQANARKYYVQKKAAGTKEKKTVESGTVALKSAEKKTKQTLKEMATISNINKARKVYWFEKFFWFITSENFLVIGGRDAQQNELIVKRYMREGDIYVHADLHGASSIVIKNPTGSPVPPKTLNEAAQFAVCFSAAWDSKVITSAYWVYPDQVSKTAQTGEYLTVGSFMVRGKKNYMPPANLVMGFGFLFKLEESSVERHKNERRVRGLEDTMSVVSQSTDIGTVDDLEATKDGEEDQEIELEDGDSSEDEEKKEIMDSIPEEASIEDEEDDEKVKDDEKVEEDDKVEDDEKVEGNENADQEEKNYEMEEVENERKFSDLSVNSGSSGNPQDKSNDDEAKKEIKDEELDQFPDTSLKVEFNRSGSVEVKLKSTESTQKPVLSSQKSGKPEKGKKPPLAGVKEEAKEEKKGGQVRGKKGKNKKIKEKYKDQDEEEREMRMKILQSDGKEKEKKSKKKNQKTVIKPQIREKRPPPQKEQNSLIMFNNKPGGGEGGDGGEGGEEEEKEKVVVNDETDMLDSLTGIPVLEDELLFAVPVCAPYSTLINYKYKVKLTPGTGKRGKACKTALSMFTLDKSASPREKDLFKSVKDQDIARNIPGKVKLSAPHLQKVKGKK